MTGESDTSNNCSSAVTVTVTVSAAPDLDVLFLSVSDNSPIAGASFTLNATVHNRGIASSAATTLRYYRSTDATISGTDTEVGTDAVGSLAAAGTSDESIGLTAPRERRHVLLRGVRGRGDGRERYLQQLLQRGDRNGNDCWSRTRSGRRLAFGERQQPGCRCVVHAVGDGAEQW